MNSKYGQIRDYYDHCHKDFKRVWHLDRCMAMHSGFWGPGTKTLAEALIRENEELARQVSMTCQDRVLDAGCGVGGSAIFLAAHYQCHVTGITVSHQQAKHALSYARKHHVNELTTFLVADFINVPYPDGSFDVVWAIESVCHAEDKKTFLQEAYRVLRKGGRLIVADGFQSKYSLTDKEAALLTRSFRGWGVSSLEIDTMFHDSLNDLRFTSIKKQDMTSQVYRSSKRLFLYSFPGFIVNVIERMLKKRGPIEQANVSATHHQFLSLKKGLWKYKVFYAEK